MARQFTVSASIKQEGKSTVWLRCGTAWLHTATKQGDRFDIRLNSIPVHPLWDGTLVCFEDKEEKP